jgi:hypothetical protein
MAINKNNNIRTDIKINSSGAVKGASRLFEKLKKGQADVSKGSAKAGKAAASVGNKAAAAGTKGAASMGLLSKGLTAAKAGVLRMIPALGGLTTAFAATGIGAIVIAVVALGAAFFGAIKKGAQFGKAVSALKGISGGTSEEVAILSQQAKDLGASTAFTATEVIKLQTELAKLGFAAGEIQQATPSILDLSAALDVDLASAAEFAGSVVRSFGLDASETKRVVDVMAASATGSAQSFSSLVESFKLAAPTARALGVTVEETGALLGALANNGLKGSIAGTGLSKVFIQLAKEGLTLDQGLEKVRNSSDKLNTAIDLVGVIGSKSLLTLAASGEDIAKLNEQLANTKEGAIDAARALAETKLDNLSGDVTKLGSAWEGFILNIEDGTGALNGLARGAIQLLTNTITFLTEAFSLVGFTVSDTWDSLKTNTTEGANIVGQGFVKLGNAIKKFANQATLYLADVPIIGKAIDKGAVQKNIDEAVSAMARAEESIQESKLKIQERYVKDQTRAARYAESKINNAIAIQKAQDRKVAEAKIEEEDEARIKKEESDGKKLIEIRKKIAKQAADQEAKTNEQKLALKRERQLAELEGLAISAQEKQDAEKAINDLYDIKKEELAEKKRLEDEEKAKVAEEKRLEKQLELDALELQRLLQDDQLKFDEREKLQIAYLEKKRLNDLKNDKLTEKEKEVINKKAEKAKEKVREAEARASKNLKDKVLNDALDGAAASFGIAQEVAVAKMLMAAPEAISGSFKEAAKAYAPPLSLAMGALGAAGTVAPIVKGLAEIKKNRFSKGGKSSGSAPSGSINTSAISAGASGVDVETISSLSANNAARLGIDPSIGGAAGSSAANNVMGGASGNVTFSESSYQSFQNQVKFREELTTVGG